MKRDKERVLKVFKLQDEGLSTGIIALRTGYNKDYIARLKKKRIEIIKSLNLPEADLES